LSAGDIQLKTKTKTKTKKMAQKMQGNYFVTSKLILM